jgi:hypothetical protein
METKLARHLGSHKRNVRVRYEEAIIIPRDPPPAGESPLPAEDDLWPKLVFGLVFALLCVWWFAPAQLKALWKSLLGTIFQ